ncbi:restriction endonuclease [Chiayiivirga flava]|uniref:Restriction endonuclease type IV Mrr domain-containing protein n=1 Tax=Chiayiivirga flava TaxID=659595 RepID=A0A7W8D5P7_9GAMM|nr:restriction endonuclease [Chiayiivirga flava]MBB5206718.1 hypothetical protein [Chiayiivirga flava]
MATIAGLLTSPPALAAIVALIVGVATVYATGALRRHVFEADVGLAALCAMKWQDFATLVGSFLGERGLQRSTSERKLGDGGFDLLLERGTSSYLVICKNAGGQQVTPQNVTDLQRTMQHEDAEGALIIACGRADVATLDLARSRGIEVIAGHALWRQIRHLLPYDIRDEAEASARRMRSRRLWIAVGAALLAGALAWAAASGLGSTPDAAVDRPQPAAPRPVAPAVPPAPTAATPVPHAAPSATGTAPGLPDPTLSEAQLETRRATSAMEVRSIPGVDDASWPTKSTLVVSMPASTGAVPDTLLADVCRVLLQYEEQRYTRLQLEVASGVEDQPPTVRWRQCR